MTFKVLVPNTITCEIPPELGSAQVYDTQVPLPQDVLDADVLVVWGMSEELLSDAAKRLKKLSWVQVLSAGAEAAAAAGFAPDVILTNGRSLHDLTVAEHALALTLAAARSLHTLVRSQIGHRWASEIGGLQPAITPDKFTTLRGARVTIWGFGSIGKTLAPHLTALGAHVTGVARTARQEGSYRVISTVELPEQLPHTDVLIMILPANAATEKSLDAAVLALLPKHAWVINVGRGATVDEEALIEALRNNEIGGAALDVTRVEPLPPSSELWDLPNVIITPHAAGGRPLGAEELIIDNLRALRSGEPMRNVME